MEHSPEHEPVILAHWIYTRHEWDYFTRWTVKRKSIIHSFFYFIIPKTKRAVPEVMISSEKVWIGGGQQHFNSNDYQLRRIDIREEGGMNVMEITYQWLDRKTPGFDEILIPVPRGKLREAIEVQQKLTGGVK